MMILASETPAVLMDQKVADFLRKHKAGPGVADIRLRIDGWRKAPDVVLKLQ
jgi:hypothetical protein